MRVLVIVSLGVALATSAAFAQQPQTFRPKKYTRVEGRKPTKAAPMAKTPNAATDAAKDLRRIEKETAKTSGSTERVGPKRAPGSANAFKPEKSKPMPPINASGSGGMGTNMKGMGTTNQGKNPYRGRLRQKGSHQ